MPAEEQQIRPDRYAVVPRTLVFLRRGETVLLMRGGPGSRWEGKYNGIGGHLERGEDVLSGARRELFEEAGLQADLWLCGTLVVDTGSVPGVLVFILTGACPTGDPRPSREGCCEWIVPADLTTLPVRFADLPLLLPRVMAAHPGDPPFFARSCYDGNGFLQVEFVD